jgi:UDP-N-acetylglucosamine 1-carboxyvinyltransferase
MVLAGLAADGTTTVRGLDYLDRGYAQLEQKLSGVGAQLQRLSSQSPLLSTN